MNNYSPQVVPFTNSNYAPYWNSYSSLMPQPTPTLALDRYPPHSLSQVALGPQQSHQYMIFKRNDSEPDIRLIIIRHGERVDAVFGQSADLSMPMMNGSNGLAAVPDWISKSLSVQGENVYGGQTIQYTPFHSNMPARLPTLSTLKNRSIDKRIDDSNGVGQILRINKILIDLCYCSPSTRTVQTAKGVLDGNKSADTCIHMDMDLFECFSWNPFLQKLPEFPFLTIAEWQANGIHNCYGTSNRPFTSQVNRLETELEYYARSARVTNRILDHAERLKGKQKGGTVNVLVAGHAPTAEAITAYLTNRPPNIEAVRLMGLRVNYLCMVMPERYNGIWKMRSSALVGTACSGGA
ncbi:hypothetical protein ACOME3_009295 [Neoechinorhynchus agilis]